MVSQFFHLRGFVSVQGFYGALLLPHNATNRKQILHLSRQCETNAIRHEEAYFLSRLNHAQIGIIGAKYF